VLRQQQQPEVAEAALRPVRRQEQELKPLAELRQEQGQEWRRFRLRLRQYDDV